MSAPEFVPNKAPKGKAKYYTSPPRREGSWQGGRPGELGGRQPRGAGLGSQGPDQGYALTIANRMRDRAQLTEGERWEDVRSGCVAVALKRASLFGRAPSAHDVTIAMTVWGFLDENPPFELLSARRRLFERIDNPHHYLELRAVADAVSDETLRAPLADTSVAYARDWESLLDLSVLNGEH